MSSDEPQPGLRHEGPAPEGRLWLLVILALILFGTALFIFTQNNPDLAAYQQQARVSQASERPARVYTVYYSTGVFSPTNLRIHAGDTVKFQNNGDNPIHINADEAGNPPGFDSVGDVPVESSFAYTFTKTGVFGYYNGLNK